MTIYDWNAFQMSEYACLGGRHHIEKMNLYGSFWIMVNLNEIWIWCPPHRCLCEWSWTLNVLNSIDIELSAYACKIFEMPFQEKSFWFSMGTFLVQNWSIHFKHFFDIWKWNFSHMLKHVFFTARTCAVNKTKKGRALSNRFYSNFHRTSSPMESKKRHHLWWKAQFWRHKNVKKLSWTIVFRRLCRI